MGSTMVRAKLQYYYTFKPKVIDGELKVVECHKWEEATGEHAEMYRVQVGVEWRGCSCPAYRACKHQKCVRELIESGRIQEPWKWRWDEKAGWQEMDDIPEEITLGD